MAITVNFRTILVVGSVTKSSETPVTADEPEEFEAVLPSVADEHRHLVGQVDEEQEPGAAYIQ